MSMQIGRVIGTEKKPNTAYTFRFWAPLEVKIGIGTLVKVVCEGQTVWGVVVEAEGFNDLESPLHEFLSVDGDPSIVPPTERPEMRVYEGAVLRREPEEPVGAVPIGEVFLADEADVQKALRTDEYAEKFGIPCGVYGSEGNFVPVYLDHRYLLGPESGHLNVTGTSGLASKTSFLLFLLSGIFQKYKDIEGERGGKGVAVLLFNTKGGDLMYLDHAAEEAASEMTDMDRAIYAACGMDAKPFENVRYYAPYDENRATLNTVRRHPELEERNRVRPLTFGLLDVLRHMEVLLNRDDLDAKADGYLQYLADKVKEGKPVEFGEGGELKPISTLEDLVEFVKAEVEMAQASNNNWRGHSGFTIRKMLNRLGNLDRRFSGLIANRGEASDPLDEQFQPNTVYVVDVANLTTDHQSLVFAALITKLRQRMENSQLGVARTVVVVDELNKYAPSGGSDTYVMKALKEISARGRYMGLTLFGAQQFRSRVDKEIVGNSATHIFGHIEAEELAQPGYSYFAPSVKEKLGTMPQGNVLVKHPHFAQPIFLRFPRPAVLKGSDGMRMYQPGAAPSAKDLLLARTRRFKNHAKTRLEILELADEPELLSDLLHKVDLLKDDEDPLPILRQGLKKPKEAEVLPIIPEHERDPFV